MDSPQQDVCLAFFTKNTRWCHSTREPQPPNKMAVFHFFSVNLNYLGSNQVPCRLSQSDLSLLQTHWRPVLTIVAVVHVDLSVRVHVDVHVHVIRSARRARGSRSRRVLCITIMQLLERPGDGSGAPGRSVAVPGVARRGQGEIGSHRGLLTL